MTTLQFDPVRRIVFQRQLTLPYKTDSYEVEFRNPDGNTVHAEVQFEKPEGPIRFPVLPPNIRSMSTVYTSMLANGKVAYIYIQQMVQYEQSDALARQLKDFYATLSGVPALIIDLRGNGGGDDRFWMLNVVSPLATESLTEHNGMAMRTGDYLQRFISAERNVPIHNVIGKTEVVEKSHLDSVLTKEQLGNLPPEVLGPGFGPLVVFGITIEPSGEYPYSGKIFLLVDQAVFSSSENFTLFCKSTGWATVVGEVTHGDGGAITPFMITLPNSKIAVFSPSTMGLNPDFAANEEMHTIPDMLIERTPEDIVRLATALAAGKGPTQPDPYYDPALRECLRLALEP